MESLIILIPIAVILIALAVGIFLWAVDSDQFDDLEGPAHSILFDDEPAKASPPSQKNRLETAMTEAPTLLAAITLGLLGSTHCIGMCGGITSALSLSLKGRSKASTGWLMLAYHAGRISSYALAGLLLGLVGWFLGDASEALQSSLRVIASGMLIAMGFYITGWWKGLMKMEKLGQHLWKHIQPLASKLLPIRSTPEALALGALWGWLPCGLVYSTLVWSASQNNPTQSALLMAAFGLGTLPSVFLTGIFARQLASVIQASMTRNIAGMMMILFGLYSIPGPHQMWVMSLLSVGHGGH